MEFRIYELIERYTRGYFLYIDELIRYTNDFMVGIGKYLDDPNTVLFFLDKGARPLAFMFRKLFSFYYPDRKMPPIRYINIAGSGSIIYDTESAPFFGNPDIVRNIYGKFIDPRKIIIIDEYMHTGEALGKAKRILSQAFPEAKIFTLAAYRKLPNWYQNPYYSGVEEYTRRDYEEIALNLLNKKLGTKFSRKSEIPEELNITFWEIYHSIIGTIPFVKRSKDRAFFTEGKKELKEICRIIIETYRLN